MPNMIRVYDAIAPNLNGPRSLRGYQVAAKWSRLVVAYILHRLEHRFNSCWMLQHK